MSGCGCTAKPAFDGMSVAYRRVLWIVIALNLAMFCVEVTAGQVAHSMALQADSLDFLGDAVTYSLSLYAIGRGVRFRAGAALVKGASLAAMGLFVLTATAWRVIVQGVPDAPVMTVVGTLALAVNVAAALLVFRYRRGDANVRSVWLCSRNDAIGNVAVIGAGAAVAITASPWPDLLVAATMATLFLTNAAQIIRQARAEMRDAAVSAVAPAWRA